jgi:serine/threonine protein kinase
MVVLEFCDGGSLDKLISKGAPFPDEVQLRAFITEVVLGLRHLHASGLIHRDLAARNILLVKDASGKLTPKIADFGMSRIVDPESEGGKTATTFVCDQCSLSVFSRYLFDKFV